MKPLVSVIIPCRNEAAFLAACLDSVLGGDYPLDRLEVLVADGGSTDDTRELLARYAHVRVIDNPAAIASAGLNRAIEEARGDVIVRLDAHSTISPNYLSRAVEYLDSYGADNVGGVMRTVARERGIFAEPIRIALSHSFGVGNSYFRTGFRTGSDTPRWVDTVFGGCWRREVFDRIGKFNEQLVRGQDLEFNLRLAQAGGRILLAPDMHSYYYARATLPSFWRHNWTNGVWALFPFAYSSVVPVRWRHLMPMLFVSSLVVSAAGWSFAGTWPLALILSAYGIASLSVSALIASRLNEVKLAVLLPVAFANLHLAYGAGSLWGAVRLLGILLARGVSRLLGPRAESTPLTRRKETT